MLENNESTIKNPSLEKKDPEDPGRPSRVFSRLTLVIAWVAFLVAVLDFQFSFTVYKNQNQAKNDIIQIVESIKLSERNFKNAQQTNEQLKSQLTALKQAIEINKNQKQETSQDWQIFKARYYLELAEINAYWDNQTQTTIALLKNADELLSRVGDPKIFAIRQTLASEITQLNAIPVVDKVGVLSQLDAIKNNINQLAFPVPLAIPTAQAAHNGLEKSMQFLQKLIIIRHHEEAIEPVTSPLLFSTLKEQVGLNLLLAQWALLNNNEKIYQMMLDQAITILRRGFNEQNTQSALRQLSNLKQIQFIQEKPSTGLALEKLNQYIEEGKSTSGTSQKGDQ